MPLDQNLSVGARQILHSYRDLVLKWQKTINLVAPSTLPQLWERHFLDSLGYLSFIEQHKIQSLADLGAGAGFPGLVLAMVKPEMQVYLVESDQRKCIFMETVSRETKLKNVTVVNDRIENQSALIDKVDLVTARALASLSDLLGHMCGVQHYKASGQAVFAKGAQFQEEIDAALAHYDFEYHVSENQGNLSSVLIHVWNISKRP